MDVFSGWPFYEPQRCWDEPGYGYHGAGYHPSMMRGPRYCDYPINPLYCDPQWYPETYSPFHRSNKFSSPFYRRNPTPFEDIFDAERPCHPRRTRTRVTTESPSRRANSPQVGTEKCTDNSVNPLDTMDVAMTSSTVCDDKATNLTPQPEPTPEAMDSQDQQPAEEPTTELLSPEINKIAEIMKKTGELEEKISAYSGLLGSKDYIYIEESLVSILLQLDKIDTNGNIEIRKARKSAVCQIQQMLTDLENKAKSNMATTETESTKMDAEAVITDEVAEASDVEQPSVVTTPEHEQETPDLSDTIDVPAVVITEETTCGAVTAELASEQSTINNVDPASTVVTSGTEEESAMLGDEEADAVEGSTKNMDCSSGTSLEDSIVNTVL